MNPSRLAILISLVALVLVPAGSAQVLASQTHAPLAKKTCKYVTKKVHGKKKRVKVCKSPPPPPPLFASPSDAAIGLDGSVYVADQGYRLVDKLSSSGKLLSRLGKAAATAGHSTMLYGIALDAVGNIYVSDAGAHQVDKLSPNGDLLDSWDTNTTKGAASFPTLMVIDPHANLYVSDYDGGKVIELSPSGKVINQLGAGRFVHPYGLALDVQGNLYVSDYGRDRVDEISTANQVLGSWGDGANGSVTLSHPEAIKLDAQNNIYVTEGSNHLVKFSSSGSVIRQWDGAGSTHFDDPSGLALDPQGNMYVVEYNANRLDKLSPTGDVLAVWK